MRICEVLQSGCIWMNDRNRNLPPISTYQEKLEWGSLSAVVNHIAFGYTHIPDFPSVQPDTSVREAPKVSPPPNLFPQAHTLGRKGKLRRLVF